MVYSADELPIVPMPMTPAEVGNFVAGEIEKWGKVIRAAKSSQSQADPLAGRYPVT